MAAFVSHTWRCSGHESGEVTVDRIAFGLLRAPFSLRDPLSDVRETGDLLVGNAVVPEAKGPDQGTMHQKIGVAADRAGEMRIARECEAKMTNIVGAICGL